MIEDKKLTPRAYVRDGVPGLTMAEQEAVLTGAGISLERCYRDALKKSQIKRRDPEDLKDRGRLLRPTSANRTEVVWLATLRVLGWTMADITKTLAVAAARGTSFHCADIGETFSADTINERLMLALAESEAARRRGQTETARSVGVMASMARAEKRRRESLAIAEPLWMLPSEEISIAEIAKKTKVSARTLQKWLGPRGDYRDAILKGKPQL